MEKEKGLRDRELFLKWIGEHYDEQKEKLQRFCSDKRYDYSDDIFQDTIIKMSDKSVRNGGFEDNTPSGFENYFFKSFQFNIFREGGYAYQKKRDKNIDDTNIAPFFEEYLGAQLSSDEKLLSDLQKDYFAYRIIEIINEQFADDPVACKAVALKLLDGYTYSKLIKKYPEEQRLMLRIKNIIQWAKENIDKKELQKEFNNTFFN